MNRNKAAKRVPCFCNGRYEMKRNVKTIAEYPDLLDINDLMQLLNIGKNLAYRIVADGTIKAKKLGRQYIITKSAVIRFLEDGDERKSNC